MIEKYTIIQLKWAFMRFTKPITTETVMQNVLFYAVRNPARSAVPHFTFVSDSWEECVWNNSVFDGVLSTVYGFIYLWKHGLLNLKICWKNYNDNQCMTWLHFFTVWVWKMQHGPAEIVDGSCTGTKMNSEDETQKTTVEVSSDHNLYLCVLLCCIYVLFIHIEALEEQTHKFKN